MKKLLLAVVFLLLVIPNQVQAACEPNIPADLTGDCKVDFADFAMMASDWLKPAVPHEWVAIYSSGMMAMAYAITVDSNDNIYVTGEGDYATVKYLPDSNQPVWVARYSSGTAYAITVDSNDNIYVTGGSEGDYATVKYLPDSNQPVWVARYSSGTAYAIAVDSNDNIYVTGRSYGSGTYWDYATIKYSPDSNEAVWVARYNGPGNNDDWAEAIAVDSNDNIYVTGFSYGGSGTRDDYTTIKYSPDSNQPVWVARYNGPDNLEDRAKAIAVDSNDNIYVTGDIYSHVTSGDYATIKYSPDSNQPVWVARYNSPANRYDVAHAIAVDSNDNIYVTGSDYTTIKYSLDSNQPVWVARYDGPANCCDDATAIAVDSNNNIYVTGDSVGSGTYTDYATVKYSPDSNEAVWVARYNGLDNGYDHAEAITVDSNDNIYVTGGSEVWTAPYATVKYSPDYTCTPEVTGDLNHDCEVDLYDLLIFCQHWLESHL